MSPTATTPLLSSPTPNTDGASIKSVSAYSNSSRNVQTEAPLPAVEGLPEVRKRLKYILPALSLGIFMIAADATLVASSYGKISDDLHGLNKASWISTSYFLSLTTCQPLYGRLSDILGRKSCILFAYVIFGLGCLLCGLARNMNELIAARAFAGIGGGGMTTVVSILLSDIVPMRERGTWQGVINIIFAGGSGVGAPVGGWLADTVGWRVAFVAQAPLCVVAIVLVAFTLQMPGKDTAEGLAVRLRRIDFGGAVVLVALVFSLLLGLDRGSNVGWSKREAWIPLALFTPLVSLFIWIEFCLAEQPFAPKQILLNRSLAASYTCSFFSFAAWFAILFYLPLYYQAVDDLNASQSGLRLLPAILTSSLASLLAGVIMQQTGKYYRLTVLAYLSGFIGIIPILLCAGLVTKSTVGVSVGLGFTGLGLGAGVTTTLIALISNAGPDEIAVTTACSYLFRSLGSVVGISMTSTIVQQSLRTQLTRRFHGQHDVEQIVRRVRESLRYVRSLPPAQQAMVRADYGIAVNHGLMLTSALAACAFLGALFVREKAIAR